MSFTHFNPPPKTDANIYPDLNTDSIRVNSFLKAKNPVNVKSINESQTIDFRQSPFTFLNVTTTDEVTVNIINAPTGVNFYTFKNGSNLTINANGLSRTYGNECCYVLIGKNSIANFVMGTN